MPNISLLHLSDFSVEETLHLLDSKLNGCRQTVHLCGSSVPILAGCKFRATQDIDFSLYPEPPVVTVINGDPELRRRFDFQAQGVIGLLVDFEEREVVVDLGFKNLEVRRLSIQDWVVSKLASPKLDDVLNIDAVDLDMLLWVESKMHLYGGVGEERAVRDLRYLIREKSES